MRKVLILLTATTVFLGAGDCSGKKATPKPSKPVIVADVVKLCIENPFDIRREEHYCTDPIDECCTWEYLSFVPDAGQVELPAMGETLRVGQGHPQPPAGSTPVIPPEQGAIWRKP